MLLVILMMKTTFPINCFNDLANISCFPTRVQDVFKTSSIHICHMSSENVFKTCLQDVLQLCLEEVLEHKKVLHWRRLEDAFKASSVRLHQDECLLGNTQGFSRKSAANDSSANMKLSKTQLHKIGQSRGFRRQTFRTITKNWIAFNEKYTYTII